MSGYEKVHSIVLSSQGSYVRREKNGNKVTWKMALPAHLIGRGACTVEVLGGRCARTQDVAQNIGLEYLHTNIPFQGMDMASSEQTNYIGDNILAFLRVIEPTADEAAINQYSVDPTQPTFVPSGLPSDIELSWYGTKHDAATTVADRIDIATQQVYVKLRIRELS